MMVPPIFEAYLHLRITGSPSLRVSREESRAGRAIKHYQGNPDAYFVLDARGRPTIDSALAPGITEPEPVSEVAMFSTWSTITLTPEAARTFSQQLQALRHDLTAQATEGRDQYIVHLGFVRLPGADEG
jgi:hypothetical protein